MKHHDSTASIAERLEVGELTWITNLSTITTSSSLRGSKSYKETERLLDGLREKYSEEHVLTGIAFDPETEAARNVSGMFGVYVVSAAFKEATPDK